MARRQAISSRISILGWQACAFFLACSLCHAKTELQCATERTQEIVGQGTSASLERMAPPVASTSSAIWLSDETKRFLSRKAAGIRDRTGYPLVVKEDAQGVIRGYLDGKEVASLKGAVGREQLLLFTFHTRPEFRARSLRGLGAQELLFAYFLSKAPRVSSVWVWQVSGTNREVFAGVLKETGSLSRATESMPLCKLMARFGFQLAPNVNPVKDQDFRFVRKPVQ